MILVMFSGCLSADDEHTLPDAGAIVVDAPIDAAECDPAPALPSCASLGCAVGALEPECPWPELSAPCACTQVTGLTQYCVR